MGFWIVIDRDRINEANFLYASHLHQLQHACMQACCREIVELANAEIVSRLLMAFRNAWVAILSGNSS